MYLTISSSHIVFSGQGFRLGRYCIHFHMHGDASLSRLKGNSIHHSFHRAIAVHGTHRLRIENNVAYDISGHAYFLEDGIEMENIFDSNLGILARKSHSSLNTDTTPAVFWITNPYNTFTNNVAAGSDAYGYWFKLPKTPEGASASATDFCPNLMPLLKFENNTAHSSDKYGLRIFEEFFPTQTCTKDNLWQTLKNGIPARFKNFVAYKNGMKGAIATSVGHLRFENFKVADNGAGPNAPKVNGKDHGGGIEMTWISDIRGSDTHIDDMPGIHGALIVAKSDEGFVGSAGYWPSDRGIRGIISQSPKPIQFNSMMAIANVTFWGFNGGQFIALEACGKCKQLQGAVQTYVKGIQFKGLGDAEGAKPAITSWSWAHQGIYQDTDGSLIGTSICEKLGTCSTVAGGSIVADNGLLLNTECFPDDQNAGGKICIPGVRHKRIMMNRIEPTSVRYYALNISHEAQACPKNEYNEHVCTTQVGFSKFNTHGYSFHVVAGRNYTIDSTGAPYRVDFTKARLHGFDYREKEDWVIIRSRYQQSQDRILINSKASTSDGPLVEKKVHGDFFYNGSLMEFNPRYNMTDSVFSVFVGGSENQALTIKAYECPEIGCDMLDGDGYLNGTFKWSEESFWKNCTACFPNKAQLQEKIDSGDWIPKASDEVIIPNGAAIILDIDTPILKSLQIHGSLTFSEDGNKVLGLVGGLSLNSDIVLVEKGGNLTVGTKEVPYALKASINLYGMRNDPFKPYSEFKMGTKILAVNDGTISVHGNPAGDKWVKLESSDVGLNAIVLTEPVSWLAGQEICISSSSWNPWEREVHKIKAITNKGKTLVLETVVRFDHSGTVRTYDSKVVDTRAEVGLMSSNIRIGSGDAQEQYHGLVMHHPQYKNPKVSLEDKSNQTYYCHPSKNSVFCKFGCQIRSAGVDSTLQLENVQIDYCGQAGIENSAVTFGSLKSSRGPSYIEKCSLTYNMDSAIKVVAGSNALPQSINVTGNFVYESLDASSIIIKTSGNAITKNLIIGTMKISEGKSKFDMDLPASIEDLSGSNTIEGNVAAGSDRLGFHIKVGACDADSDIIQNNVAHSSLVGLMMRNGTRTCSQISKFVSHHNWDFGILASVQGIPTDVVIRDSIIADTKHAGVLVLRRGPFTEEAKVSLTSNVFVGSSFENECKRCRVNSDTGCHLQLSMQSYKDPAGPSCGLMSTAFSLAFVPGPEQKPWDKPHGYPLIHGISNATDNVFANFGSQCGHKQYAFMNHKLMADVFHPVLFSKTKFYNVSKESKMKLTGPDEAWRNPSDCGVDVFDCKHPLMATSSYCSGDKTVNVPLNCQGGKHIVVTDADGSFGETPHGNFFLGHMNEERPDIAQGTMTRNPTCQPSLPGFSDGAYQCSVNASVNNDPPQLLVIESRDADTEDRNFSPLILATNSSKNILINTMDQGWCFGYTCQKRLSTFWTYAHTDTVYSLDFTGTPSKMLRFWIPYAPSGYEIILKINYFTPGRRFIWSKSPGRISPLKSLEECVGRDGKFLSEEVKQGCIPKLGDGQPHGSYFWHQSETMLYVKLLGGQSLEIRTEPVVQVSAKLAMSFSDFYEDRYIANMARVLNIDPSRIKIVSVVPGSVVIDMIITQEPRVLEESGIYGEIPEKEFDAEAATVEPEASSASSNGTDDTSSAAPPPPQTDSQTEEASSASNNFLKNMEEIQKKASEQIQAALTQVAQNGELEASLQEAFPGATYMDLAVTSTTSATDEASDESTTNIIVGAKEKESEVVPLWVIILVVGLLMVAATALSLVFYVKRISSTDEDLDLADYKFQKKGFKESKKKSKTASRIRSWKSRFLPSPKRSGMKVEDISLEGEPELLRRDTDLEENRTNPLSTKLGPLKPVVVKQNRISEDNPTFVSQQERRFRSESFQKVNRSVSEALEAIEKDLARRALEEAESDWRRADSIKAVENSVQRALSEIESEPSSGGPFSLSLTSSKSFRVAVEDSVQRALSEIESETFQTDVEQPMARSGLEMAKDALNSRSFGKAVEDSVKKALAEVESEYISLEQRPGRSNSEMARSALSSGSFGAAVDDSVQRALAEIEEEEERKAKPLGHEELAEAFFS